MAKTIKFNLICDGHPVRTLDDLREHFSIEDVLDHHKNGMLARWLEVRRYENELEAVNAIPIEDKVNAAKALVKAFAVEMDNTKVEEIGYLLQYEDQRKKAEKKFSERHDEKMEQLKALLACYQNLKKQMAEHKDNFAALKADVAELHTEYMTAFELDYRSLFYYLKEKAPAAIYMMLAHTPLRERYIPSSVVQDEDPYKTESVDAVHLEDEVDFLFIKTRTSTVNRASFLEAVRSKEDKELLARRLARCHNTIKSQKHMSYETALEEITNFLGKLFPERKSDVRTDTMELYNELCSMTTNQNIKHIFEGKYDRFHIIKRNTHGNWDDMIDRKEKCMVLWMAEKCEVRPSGCRDICYKASDVKNQFMLLDGVDYRSQLATTELLVLEV